jgi:hypothetical protein
MPARRRVVSSSLVLALLGMGACTAGRTTERVPAEPPPDAAPQPDAAVPIEGGPQVVQRPDSRAEAAGSDAATAARTAAFAEHVRELRAKLPSDFTVLVEPPFVVVGNGRPEAVQRSAERTVRWAVDLLKQDYFPLEPQGILDVYLFQDAASYDRYRTEWFGGGPETPYGFYSDDHHALVMNIATGGGTLVHEIVHPLLEANFPGCPAWFNEGLGSLYEQAGSRDGHIIGYTNWRLAGLKRAIRAGELPAFETLTGMSTHEFYDEDRGTNYAQARYLLYYLQERGLLRPYYRAFVASRLIDPSGYETLRTLLGRPDMRAFQREWEAFVLGLTFP